MNFAVDFVPSYITGLAGLFIGVTGAVIFLNTKNRAVREKNKLLEEEIDRLNTDFLKEMEKRAVLEEKLTRIPELEKNLQAYEEKVNRLQNENAEKYAQISELRTRLEFEQETNKEKLELLKRAKEELNEVFKALSAEALKSNNQAFLELAKATLEKFQVQAAADLEKRQASIDELVKPLKESLEKVDNKINELEQKRTGAYASLIEQIKTMATGQEKLQRETARLVTALRTPAVRGRWGEIQLKRVVEVAGMLEYCDFTQQKEVSSESGKLRPDMIIKLPGNKNIVVDSKVPLSEYLEAVDVLDEEQKILRLQGHAKQVRNHISKLAAKSYWAQFEFTPEFVIMFLPGETFFSAALQYDPTLIEYGAEQRVILATPTTLIALLKTVAYGWKQEQINENARQISQLGKMLYERLSVLTDHFLDIRKGLHYSVQAFNKTVGSFENRVLVTARKFGELGIVSDSEIKQLEVLDTGLREIASGEENKE